VAAVGEGVSTIPAPVRRIGQRHSGGAVDDVLFGCTSIACDQVYVVKSSYPWAKRLWMEIFIPL